MSNAHFKFWPAHAMHRLIAPATNLFYNAEVSARRYPDKPFLVYYDTQVSFSAFHDEAERVAGYLQQKCGVQKGDRVLLLMQNSPQFMIGYYGILRANAVVVPLNPMNLTQEILRYAKDAGAVTMLVSQELYPRVEPLLESGDLRHVIVAAYSDYLKESTTLAVPDFISAPRVEHHAPGLTLWKDVLAGHLEPGPLTAGPDDLCVMPYTSGTTGQPKGCMHTHRTVMHTTVASMQWFAMQPEMTLLAVAPMFHVTGMQGGMNGPLFIGNTMVLLPRWDREVAAQCVERYKIASWTAIPTMIQDFFLNPNVDKYDLSSIRRLSGGGAAMPAAVAQRLAKVGITYVEGYGLTETIAATHINPGDHPKAQCLGIPIFDVDSRIIDPATLRELPPGEVGEIIMHGPQVFLGYWKKPEDTAQVFIELDGKKFFRSGDLGRMDEDGYFFIVDRLKRMINASGYKVWPTEIESLMYQHPAVQEACVIGAKDAHRGETVKAIIVTRPEWRGKIEAQAIIDWCRENMAAYKVPRVVEFVDALPKSGSGKIMWRELQELENAKSTSPMAAQS
ncbi:MAG TPA: long-chain fatty acid--CoA ligase [Steroidobacteraceae bacterium]|jgi:fatty-acyl-CoA synthase|nr:long-chain fatty acid--CoA ligase [Steroidobacteraceae bacterium]